jgi:hypothetical protein
MDQRVVRSCQFVDLNFESEINSDVSSVVVVLLLGIGKSYKDSGVVVEGRHHPLEPQHVPRRRWAIQPQHSQVRAGMSLESAAANEEPARIVAPRLVLDRRHSPVAHRLSVEKHFETRVSDKRGRR